MSNASRCAPCRLCALWGQNGCGPSHHRPHAPMKAVAGPHPRALYPNFENEKVLRRRKGRLRRGTARILPLRRKGTRGSFRPRQTDRASCEAALPRGLTLERKVLARRATRREERYATHSAPRVCRRAARSTREILRITPAKAPSRKAQGTRDGRVMGHTGHMRHMGQKRQCSPHNTSSRIDLCHLLHFSILKELFEPCAMSHTREGGDSRTTTTTRTSRTRVFVCTRAHADEK